MGKEVRKMKTYHFDKKGQGYWRDTEVMRQLYYLTWGKKRAIDSTHPLRWSIDELELTRRSSNCLRYNTVNNQISEIKNRVLDDFLAMPNCGRKSAREIVAVLDIFDDWLTLVALK
jgi:DNA-directed RNA polymerase alpha subunit